MRRLTQLLVVVACALVGVCSVLIEREREPDNWVGAGWLWLKSHPVVPALVGVIAGHAGWPPRRNVPTMGPWVIAVWGIVLAICDWAGMLPNIRPEIVFPIGFFFGAWLWGMRTQAVK